jgi:hypothetical protein
VQKSVFRFSIIGPSGVRALPLAAGIIYLSYVKKKRPRFS